MIFLNKNLKPKLIPNNIIITKKAFLRIKFLIKKNINNKLRIFIKGGGCSGFKYGFIIIKNINYDDIIINIFNIKIIIDFISYQYLIGSIIDFYENIESSKFIIKNPNAITTCSCGSSFSM